MRSNPSLADSLKGDPFAALAAVRAARAIKAEADFSSWLPLETPEYTWDWPHLRLMRDFLAEVTAGLVRCLMISCPPRHGKTEQNTIRYAAWRIVRDPACRVIIGAYNQRLAEKMSRKVRRIVEKYVPLDPQQQAVADWATFAGGGVRAAGVGSGVTSYGANVILIDDPVKSRAEAESEAYRQRVVDWYTDDLFTRQEPGCVIILTMTRWHELDLAGWLLQSESASDWKVINLPAIADHDPKKGEVDPLGREVGEALCPDRYPVAELMRRLKVMGRNFFALFQGKPRPAEGNKYRRSWFRYWTRPDKDATDLLRLARDDGRTRTVKLADCRVFATVDLAVTTKTSSDYTVIAVWAVTPTSDLVLLDLYRDRIEEPAIVDLAYQVFEKWKPGYFAVESNGIGTPIIQNLRRGGTNEEGVRRPGLPVRGIAQQADKLSRASTAIVRTEAGQVFFPANATWLEAFEAELLNFGPKAAHDDQVDVLSMAAEDVFWRGGSGIEDEEAQATREAAEKEAEEKAQDEWQRINNPAFWGESW